MGFRGVMMKNLSVSSLRVLAKSKLSSSFVKTMERLVDTGMNVDFVSLLSAVEFDSPDQVKAALKLNGKEVGPDFPL